MTEQSSRNQDTTVDMWSLHVNEIHDVCVTLPSKEDSHLILVLEPVRQSTKRLLATRLQDTQRRNKISRRFKENL
jgi:hypothetical protein